MQAENAALQAQLKTSEDLRIADALDFQRQLEAAATKKEDQPKAELLSVTEALLDGSIQSVLILGDSISDGNGDLACLYEQSEREAAGTRLIYSAEETFYENAMDAQGWVSEFRDYLTKRGQVEVFHNNAVGGKSAKWFNARKEALIPQEYDAIFVMLGTNDRWDCESPEEFYAEYGRLLAYAAEKCTYLTVITPIPVLGDAMASDLALTSRQIADTVAELCSNTGYTVVNAYDGLMEYAAGHGDALGQYYFGETHPCGAGYEALWYTIAGQLGLPLKDGSSDAAQLIYTGSNREDLTGNEELDAVDGQGIPYYPQGISAYYTLYPFADALPNGAFVETHRYEDGTGIQYARNTGFDLDGFCVFRRYDGGWSEWMYVT